MPIPKLIWFEIPVTDMERAVRFYETIFDCTLLRSRPDETMFGEADDAWGCLLLRDDNTPSLNGPLITFDVGDALPAVLERVGAAGGAVLTPKTLIAPDVGYDASLRDSEGNRISLFSRH